MKTEKFCFEQNNACCGPDLPWYCLNCTKFGRLILRKIIGIAATRCHILKPKCAKFNSGCGSAPEPFGGAYSGPSGSLAGFEGPISDGRKDGKEVQGRGEGKGGEGEGEGLHHECWGMDTPDDLHKDKHKPLFSCCRQCLHMFIALAGRWHKIHTNVRFDSAQEITTLGCLTCRWVLQNVDYNAKLNGVRWRKMYKSNSAFWYRTVSWHTWFALIDRLVHFIHQIVKIDILIWNR